MRHGIWMMGLAAAITWGCSDGGPGGPGAVAGDADGAGSPTGDASDAAVPGGEGDPQGQDAGLGDVGAAPDAAVDGVDPQDTRAPSDGGGGSDAHERADAEPGDAVSDDGGGADAEPLPPAPTPICVALRGNGPLITAHFASLARLAELFGPFEGVAGGSSASITSFLAESMHMHPLLWQCPGGTCTTAQAGARIGLMFKSLYGYLGAMGEQDEALALGRIMELVQQAQAEGIGVLVELNMMEDAWSALSALLTSPDVQALVNLEVVGIIDSSPDLAWHVADLWESLMRFGSFEADDPAIFSRPGVVNFAGLASHAGRFGSFYAGYGQLDEQGWRAFFDACAEPGVGLLWHEVATLDSGDGLTCGARFAALLDAWRAHFIPLEDVLPNRIDEPVGAHLRALAITSVLGGATAASVSSNVQLYAQAQHGPLQAEFLDVSAGYWGQDEHTAPVAANALGYGDLKSAMARSLGPGTWREALSLSPAEPGLARAMLTSDGEVSAGGWPDLEPVLALKSAGCERVVYVTRRGPASGFGRGVAALLGASAEQDAALFDLSDPDSSYARSVSEADGVWCTDWNAFPATDIGGIMVDAYFAPFEVREGTLVPVGPEYPLTAPAVGLPGCTPGVTD